MSTESYVPIIALTTRVVGVGIAGIMTGYAMAASHQVMPAILDPAVGLSADKLIRTWSAVFDTGKAFAVRRLPIGALAFFTSAYLTHNVSAPPSILGIQGSTHLALAGAALLASAPYTIFFMFPTSIKRLKNKLAIMDEAVHRGEAVEPKTLDMADTRADVEDWTRRNTVRMCFFATSFLLGITF
ncbi:hypothetical protein FRB98_007509 [Tulasnella sp. 332]|nr:hypothetical protein FRB98_007509 [Tulasnella sp. 332]